ncbi:protein SPMIP2 [Eucyclogobius newberryi]|uniref:protein SPMIP2 n=1 Tax=Eucyclogobius newberryi TaxID=166745 RepID=UPI003B5ABF56
MWDAPVGFAAQSHLCSSHEQILTDSWQGHLRFYFGRRAVKVVPALVRDCVYVCKVGRGPDGVGDFRPRRCDFPRYIGEGGGSTEATGDLGYLWRAGPHTLPHRPRDSYVGGVGWAWHYNHRLNQDALLSDLQIKKTDIRAAVEDTVAQRFQTAPHKKKAADSELQAHKKFPRQSVR